MEHAKTFSLTLKTAVLAARFAEAEWLAARDSVLTL
jgi:hypothetical protein